MDHLEMNKTHINDLEREIIILNSAWKMIDDMVNWAIFSKDDRINISNLTFKSEEHTHLFIILLGDFLSQIQGFKGQPVPLGLHAAPSNASPSDLTFLFHLRQVCKNPQLNSNVSALAKAVEDFASWLEYEFTVAEVNFSAINIIADLRVSRCRYIKMCGDIAKHNLLRLEANVKYLHDLLDKSGHLVSEQEVYISLDSFFEWFQENIFTYHSSQIGEYLNNIRWEIYNYLQIEFKRSWHITDENPKKYLKYSYNTPRNITQAIAKSMYWDAMNRSRTEPYMQKFSISPDMKKRY